MCTWQQPLFCCSPFLFFVFKFFFVTPRSWTISCQPTMTPVLLTEQPHNFRGKCVLTWTSHPYVDISTTITHITNQGKCHWSIIFHLIGFKAKQNSNQFMSHLLPAWRSKCVWRPRHFSIWCIVSFMCHPNETHTPAIRIINGIRSESQDLATRRWISALTLRTEAFLCTRVTQFHVEFGVDRRKGRHTKLVFILCSNMKVNMLLPCRMTLSWQCRQETI